MAGADRSSCVAGAVITAVLLASVPLPALASDAGDVKLGSGPLAVALDDLDGDGAREIIAVLAEEGEPLVMDAWTHAESEWRSLGRVPVPVVGAADRTRASAYLDGIGLLAVRAGGERETLLFTAPDAVDAEPGQLAIHAVEVRDGRLSLRQVGGALGPIETVIPVDVDGDGFDELVAFAVQGTLERQVALLLLTRSGPGWTSIPLPLPGVPGDLYFNGLADTDGMPGSEIFVAGGPEFVTWRVAIDPDGRTQVDRLLLEGTEVGAGHPESLWLAGSLGGRALISWAEAADVVTVTWERGSAPRIERHIETGELGSSLFVIGTGEHERVVLVGASGADHGPIRIMDREMSHEEARVEVDPITDEVWDVLSVGSWTNDLSGLEPSFGPIAYGLDGGAPAVALSGTVAWVDADGRLEVQPARPTLGMNIVGSVGPGDTWLALAEGWPSAGDAFLRPIGPSGEAPLAVIPREAVIGEAARAEDAGITFERLDGREIVDDEGTARIATGDEGFHVRVAGPEGSLIFVHVGRQVQKLLLTDEPRDVTVRRASSAGNREYRATLIVVTPVGLARHEAWDALTVSEPPELSVEAATVEGELAATVRGTVEQTGGEVLVDGRPVPVAADGSFETTVDAPIWPRGVEVVARDILGAEARTRVEVLGLVDYRGWPWAAVVAALTISAGAILFLRIPRADRHPPQAVDDGDGVLEDIVGD